MEKNSPTSDPIVLLGFTLAHAAWSIADAQAGELLCPLAFIEKDGKLELSRFESELQEDAISRGKVYINDYKNSSVVSSFAREGLIPDQNKKVDVILVECWTKYEVKSYGVIQKFAPNEGQGKFRLLGEPIVLIDSEIQTEEVAEKLRMKLDLGIQAHKKVAQLWNQWKA